MSLSILKATISSYEPNCMSDDDASNLEQLLSLPAFSSLYKLVEDKLEKYWEWLQANPRCEFEKPKKDSKVGVVEKKQNPTLGVIDKSSRVIWFQVDPKSGLLTPAK